MIQIGVAGALGRMGRAIEDLARARPDMALAARIDRPGAVTTDGGSPLVSPRDAIGLCQVIVDFSTPQASADLAALAAAQGGPALVLGTTGFTPEQERVVTAAAGSIAIVKSGNFSLGVNLLALLVEEAARRLAASDWDIEVLDIHHRRKADAPSGTALMLGHAAALGRGEADETSAATARIGQTGPRPRGGVGYAAMRGGGVVGDHSVIFAAEDETLTLSHSARDRSLFARGALSAAAWVSQALPGLYEMKDVLGA